MIAEKNIFPKISSFSQILLLFFSSFARIWKPIARSAINVLIITAPSGVLAIENCGKSHVKKKTAQARTAKML